TGLKVLGWVADETGRIDTNAPLREVVIPKGATIDPLATTGITYEGNLDSRVNGKLTLSSTSAVIDGREVTFEIVPTGNFNEFEWRVTWTDSSANKQEHSGIIRVNNLGEDVFQSEPNNFTIGAVSVTPPQVATDTDPGLSFTWSGGSSVDGLFEPPPTSITTIEVFDSLGRTHEVVTHFRRIDDSRWEWWAEDAAGNRLNDDPS